jgi:hypothetical protein
VHLASAQSRSRVNVVINIPPSEEEEEEEEEEGLYLRIETRKRVQTRRRSSSWCVLTVVLLTYLDKLQFRCPLRYFGITYFIALHLDTAYECQ